MTERTEELALAGLLPIVVGGQRVELRTLNIDESEEWLARLGDLAAKFDVPDSNEPAQVFAAFAKQPAAVMLELVAAYDVDGVLGPIPALRKRMRQAEVYAALKQMVTAELPFVTDARSVAEAFGPQLRAMAGTILYQALVRFQPESSTNGRSPTGDSILGPSARDSARNGSSSSGATDSDDSSESPS